jgi:tellurite resistance protein
MDGEKKIEDTLYELMAHAEELQRAADQQMANVNAALRGLETETGKAIAASVCSDVRDASAEARKAAVGVIEDLKKASESASVSVQRITGEVQNTWRQGALYIVAFGVAVMLVVFGASFWTTTRLRREAVELREQIAVDRETAGILYKATWGVNLIQGDNGKRWIRLKKGDVVGDVVTWKTGEQGIEIISGSGGIVLPK